MEQPLKNREKPEQYPILTFFRNALESKNLKALSEAVNYIQMMVEKGDTHCTPMSEKDLAELAETGEGVLFVGTGTSGQRIYIKNGELEMPATSEKDRELGKRYHQNFRFLFDLKESDEMRIPF